ncbi:putative thioredoxin-like protein [Vibrio phage KIT04]|nr:putative thioredoxin-like protein [Vibrio phage KIT04]
MKLFMASWCKYCQPVKELIKEKELDVQLVDVDHNFELASKHQITQIPALVLEDDTVMLESLEIIRYLETL